MMKNKKVYIILINVDNWPDTIECINSIYINEYPGFQVILIENSKEDESLAKISDFLQGEKNGPINKESKFYKIESIKVPYIIYNRREIEDKSLNKPVSIKMGNSRINHPLVIIKNNKVSGFSENNNIGLKYALLKNDFEYIWMLNSDTVIQKSSLTALVEEMEKDDRIGLVGSVLKYYDRPNLIQCIGGGKYFNILGLGRGFKKNCHEEILNRIDKELIEQSISNISGASFFIKKGVLKDVDLWDEDYFLYGDDLDFSCRVLHAGWRKSVALKSIVFHKQNASTKKIRPDEFYFYHNSRSSILFAKKHLSIIVTLISIIPIIINSFRRSFSIKVVYASLRGIISGLKFKIEKKSNKL